MNQTLILLFVFLVEIPCALFVASLLIKIVWLPIQKEFPQQPIAEPHFRRNYQSLSFGIFNAGFSFHIAVDDDHLHLIPAWILRMAGSTTASIPWSAIRMTPKQPWFSNQARAKLGKTEVVGPAWCFAILKLPASHASGPS